MKKIKNAFIIFLFCFSAKVHACDIYSAGAVAQRVFGGTIIGTYYDPHNRLFVVTVGYFNGTQRVVYINNYCQIL